MEAPYYQPRHEPRYQPQTYRELDTAFIPANGWPKTLIDLALSRGVMEHKLLRHTGIFYDDVVHNNTLLAPSQLFRLIENVMKHPQGYELAFLAGSNFFSSPYPPDINAALCNAENVQDFLDLCTACSDYFSPLLGMHLHFESDRLVIYWHDNFGATDAMLFLLAMMHSAVRHFTRWRAGNHLQWTFYFSHRQPSQIEQYQVHLGENVYFNSHTAALTIPRVDLHQHWPGTSSSSVGDSQIEPNPRGFLHEVYFYLQSNLQHSPNLHQCARDFGMSPASLKRKLQKHRSNFQQQLDLVRKHTAFHLLSDTNITHEKIARQLHFYDAANLRRAFKRWTGQLPGKL